MIDTYMISCIWAIHDSRYNWLAVPGSDKPEENKIFLSIKIKAVINATNRCNQLYMHYKDKT